MSCPSGVSCLHRPSRTTRCPESLARWESAGYDGGMNASIKPKARVCVTVHSHLLARVDRHAGRIARNRSDTVERLLAAALDALDDDCDFADMRRALHDELTSPEFLALIRTGS